jgi:hypothetical protein
VTHFTFDGFDMAFTAVSAITFGAKAEGISPHEIRSSLSLLKTLLAFSAFCILRGPMDLL